MSEKYQNLEQALKAKVPTEKGKDLPVSKIIDVEQIALAIEEKAGAKNLGAVLANLEKNIFAGGEISDKIKEPNKTKLRQGIAKALETVFNSLEFFEEQVIEGSLMGEFPVGVMGKNPSAEDVSNAVEVIRNLIVSYIEAIKEFYDASELTTEQQQLFGLVEDKADAKEADPADLVEFAEEVAAIEQRLTTENDLDGDFFDPREEYRDGKNVIEYLEVKINYFKQIYDLSAISGAEARGQVIGLTNKYIRPAELLIVKLTDWVEKIDEKQFEDWKTSSSEYQGLDQELKKYEENRAGVALDGSVNLDSHLKSLKVFAEKFEKAIEGSSYNGDQEQFSEVVDRLQKVQTTLQVAQYKFLLKDLLSVIQEVEGQKQISEGKKKGLFSRLETARYIASDDALSDVYFSKNVSEVYGIITNAQKEATKLAIEIKERYQRSLSRVEDKDTDAVVEVYRKMTLAELIREYHTNDVNSDQRPFYYKVLDEKYEELHDEFISYALDHDKLGENGRPLPRAKIIERAELRYQAFVKLCKDTAGLVEFGILRGGQINDLQGTAMHEEILKKSNTPNAMATNISFNENPFVRAIGENIDQGEMYSEGMGIVQMIVYAAFQEMKKKTGPTTNEEASFPARSFSKNFSRNQGYGAQTMAGLIEYVRGLNDVVTHEGKTVKVNIAGELAKYPKFVQDMIAQTAWWKICRDDLGSKAGVWHWGRNKGAFKFVDGNEKGMPDGLLAGICYQVGKNSKVQGHLAVLGFLTPQRTDFIRQEGRGGWRSRPTHEKIEGLHVKDRGIYINDLAILFGINKVDRYLMYLHPQLKETGYYGDIDPVDQVYTAPIKHQPKNWWEDFPGLDHFFNKTGHKEGEDEKDMVFTGADYIKSRDAVQKIIELGIQSLLFKVPLGLEEIEHDVGKKINDFMSEIGKAMAYIGPYTDPNRDKSKDPKNFVPNELNYVHELILASFRFYIMNILVNVPQLKEMPMTEVAARKFRKKSGHTRFGSDTVLSEAPDPDYYARYRKTISVIRETISKNGTLGPYWPSLINGQNAFLNTYDFRNIWRDESRRANEFTTWLFQEMNKQAVLHGESPMRYKDSLTISETGPEVPYVFKGDSVWSGQASNHD